MVPTRFAAARVPNFCTALSIRARSLATFWTTAVIRIPTITSDGAAMFQRRPAQYRACEGRNISITGAMVMTPMASPTHQVNQPIAAGLGSMSPAASWVAMPMVGAIVLPSRPPKAK